MSLVIAIDRRFLEGTVHVLDLTIGPRVVGFGQAVFDTVGSADLIEAVDPVTSRPAIAIFWQVGKLDTVIGQHRMQPVCTTAISASRKRTAVGRSALSCNSTKANFEVRFATNR